MPCITAQYHDKPPTNREENCNFDLDLQPLAGDGFQLAARKRKCATCSKWERKFRIKVRKLVKTQGFYWTVIVLVFLNTTCVTVEHHHQPVWLRDFLCKLIQNVNHIYVDSHVIGE